MTKRVAIVRQPSPLIAQGQVTHIDRVPLDRDLAFAQHHAYVALLQRHRFEIVEAPATPLHPDGLFVEDALVIVDDLGIVTRPGAMSRRGEVDGLRPFVSALGLETHRIEVPATLDGGDVLVTDRHVFVGQTSRSNADALTQMRSIVGSRRTVLGVAVHGCLHLKSAITAVPDGSLICVRDWIDSAFFEQLGYVTLEAKEYSGGDVLCLDQTVVLPADAPQTAEMLRARGFAVEEIDLSELQKIEAGVTCMSVLLRC